MLVAEPTGERDGRSWDIETCCWVFWRGIDPTEPSCLLAEESNLFAVFSVVRDTAVLGESICFVRVTSVFCLGETIFLETLSNCEADLFAAEVTALRVVMGLL